MSGLITGYDPKTQNFIDTDLFDVSKHVTQTSGVLEVGVSYTIITFVAGDNFTNVGGTNVTGNVFVATGTTPTTYTNGSTLAKYVTQSYTYAELKDEVSEVKTIKVSLTAAQIKALPTTSITLIAAPGAGRMNQVISAIAKLNYGTVAFDQSSDLQIRADESTGDPSFITPSLLNLTADSIISFQDSEGASPNYVENNNIKIRKGGSDSTVGDGTVDIYLTYRVITL